MIARAWATMVLSVLSCALIARAEEPTPPEPRFVVPRIVEGGFELTLFTLTGQPVRSIVKSEHPLVDPAWSPDGKQLAYLEIESNSVCIVYLVDADGKNRRQPLQVSGPQRSPAWSPSGEWLAVVSGNSGRQNIWLVRPDGKEPHAITQSITTPLKYPAFSPDGKTIAYSDRLVFKKMDADGKNQSILIGQTAGFTGCVVWNADGGSIIYAGYPDDQNTQSQIFVSNIDGTGKELLTRDARSCCFPALSPDGQYIAYARLDDTAPRADNGGISRDEVRVPADLMLYDTLTGLHTEILHACMPAAGPRVAWQPVSEQK